MNVVKVVKIVSMALSVVGMIGSSWADSKTNTKTLEKLAEEHFKTK